MTSKPDCTNNRSGNTLAKALDPVLSVGGGGEWTARIAHLDDCFAGLEVVLT
jgi:hypothetical protein